jgi:hypothetical protein
MQHKNHTIFDRLTQYLLPTFTCLGFMFTAMKKPEIGLLFNASAQVFWLYSGWKAWKNAGQIGIFVTSVIISFFLTYGIINYWFIK